MRLESVRIAEVDEDVATDSLALARAQTARKPAFAACQLSVTSRFARTVDIHTLAAFYTRSLGLRVVRTTEGARWLALSEGG